MFSRITRLELLIVVGTLLVLVFWTRPPTSGNAEVRFDAYTSQETDLRTVRPPASDPPLPAPVPPPVESEPAATTGAEIGDSGVSDAESPAASVPTPPKITRIGTVDARNCDSLNYKDVLTGEIKVRKIWNGATFEWRKVCEVKEKDGTISVWSFDENDNVILSELPPQPAPENQ
jgi:hypothetical protein